MTILWNATLEEMELISKIADRAVALADGVGYHINKMQTVMDIEACHCNGNPLQLEELLNADDFNFVHDVWGIRKHINRNNGKLEDFFVPRFSK